MQRPGQRPLSARGNVPVVGARQKDPHDDFRGAPREGAKLVRVSLRSISMQSLLVTCLSFLRCEKRTSRAISRRRAYSRPCSM